MPASLCRLRTNKVTCKENELMSTVARKLPLRSRCFALRSRLLSRQHARDRLDPIFHRSPCKFELQATETPGRRGLPDQRNVSANVAEVTDSGSFHQVIEDDANIALKSYGTVHSQDSVQNHYYAADRASPTLPLSFPASVCLV
ncbi:uncharacterized protein SCHCODRAFT_02211715 [Schizophyllum commune H4-8]|uniref:Expressed protein n=1 Tax=Schizophyllum commune (strain H4-8 / FGSC 9210) TaxID=578458 RepID=D8Q2Q7_SCHCM|nr:uncharacterized protein SCHCODRAFT_02211715 [Schizophyllum commune H4-8]KAI5894560.1 hypothetical protein SCHCODRAFT_02211715 [Schizophyllum commune H4-8]